VLPTCQHDAAELTMFILQIVSRMTAKASCPT
jgi:hypothetical protein